MSKKTEIKLNRLTWPELKEVTEHPHAVLFPIGSTEQHGLALPLNTDSFLSTSVCDLAAIKVMDKRTIRVLVAPSLDYTDVSGFRERGFPGCIGVSKETQIKVIEEVCRDFIISGIRNVILVNGHAPNETCIAIALERVAHDHPEIGLFSVRSRQLVNDTFAKLRKSTGPDMHGGEYEAALSLATQPEYVHLERGRPEKGLNYSISKQWLGPVTFQSRKYLLSDSSGIMSDPTVATKEFGEILMGEITDKLAQIIIEVVEWKGKMKGWLQVDEESIG